MRNPIAEGWYADPESRVYGDTVYIYVTHSLPFDEQKNLSLFYSKDLKSFTHAKELIVEHGLVLVLSIALHRPVSRLNEIGTVEGVLIVHAVAVQGDRLSCGRTLHADEVQQDGLSCS